MDMTSTPTSANLLQGRYRLGPRLGSGGMAEVFRARDLLLERDVAVKVFRRGEMTDAFSGRNTDEVHLAAGLRHPGIVTVYDAGRDESEPAAPFAYLVMELVDGPNLAARIADGPMPPHVVASIGAQLADALAHVHARQIVHRDLKPANVLLADGPDGVPTAKLTDFGVARLLEGTRHTMTGTTVGTANYLSPEQTRGQDVTGASDIYSLGLVLLECLTGVAAYPGSGVEAALARLRRRPAIPAALGPGWQHLLERMTADDPTQRPSAAAVAGALRGLDDATVVLGAAIGTTAPLAVARRRRWRPTPMGWAIGAAAAVVALGAILAVALGSNSATAGQGANSPSNSPLAAPTGSTTPTAAHRTHAGSSAPSVAADTTKKPHHPKAARAAAKAAAKAHHPAAPKAPKPGPPAGPAAGGPAGHGPPGHAPGGPPGHQPGHGGHAA